MNRVSRVMMMSVQNLVGLECVASDGLVKSVQTKAC